MDFRLTDVQEMTRDMVRDFAQNEVKPAALELDKKTEPEGLHPLGPPQEGLQTGSAHDRHPRGVGRRRRRLHHPGHHPRGAGRRRSRLRQHHPGLLHGVAAAGARAQPGAARRVPAQVPQGRHLPPRSRPAPSPTPAPIPTSCTTRPARPSRPTPNGRATSTSSTGPSTSSPAGGVAKLYFLYARTDKKGPISTSMSVFLVPVRHSRLHDRPVPQQVRPPAAGQRRTGVPERPHPGPLPHRQRGRGLGLRGRRRGRPAEGLEQRPRRSATVRPAGRRRQPGHRPGLLRRGAQLLPAAHPGRQAGHRAAARGHRPGPDEGADRGGPGPSVQVVLGVGERAPTTIPRWACSSKRSSTRSA